MFYYIQKEDFEDIKRILSEVDLTLDQREIVSPLIDNPDRSFPLSSLIKGFSGFKKEQRQKKKDLIRAHLRRINDRLNEYYETYEFKKSNILVFLKLKAGYISLYGMKIPLGIHKYHCFQAGALIFPCCLVTSDVYNFERGRHVHVHWGDCNSCEIKKIANCDISRRHFHLPDDMAQIKKEKSKQIEKGTFRMRPDPQFKLQKFTIFQDPVEEEREHIDLYFCNCDYFDYRASNHQISDEFMRKNVRGIREKYAKDFRSLKNLHLSPLANIPGVSPLVVNQGKKECLLVQRSKGELEHYPGFWQVSVGGGINPKEDLDQNGLPDPFKGAQREIKRELDLDVTLPQIDCLGLGIDFLTGQPEFLFLVDVTTPLEEIQRSAERFEFERPPQVVKMPDEAVELLKRGIWSPTSAALVILTLERMFSGFNRAQIRL